MNIIINGALTAEAVKIKLEQQLNKTKVINEFCETNNIAELNYKDAELEYNFTNSKKKTGGAKK